MGEEGLFIFVDKVKPLRLNKININNDYKVE